MYKPLSTPQRTGKGDQIPANTPVHTAEKKGPISLHASFPAIRKYMGASITFGQLAGIPLKLHANWFLMAILIIWSLSATYFPLEYPGWDRHTYWVTGIITAFLFFSSVLLHEIGHALVAQREGVPVNSITLFILGGVAQIAHEPETPGSEFRIVAAGPLTSLLLAISFSWLGNWDLLTLPVRAGAAYLGQVNLILALFNLIPGFPLDGGRILRAALWKLFHNFQRATRYAATIGLGIGVLSAVIGIGAMGFHQAVTGLWLVFIGWYLSTAAQEGYRQACGEELTSMEELDLAGPQPVRLDPIVTHPAVQPSRFVLARVPVEELARPPFVSQPYRKCD